ncbi:MAG: type II toxin-antitoxin system RelE/ParE family toxin [Micrococcales bacterium]|nr:type II toxin-antitoxin system RelE/ParE family toxin [Micrococcales bacterium]
MTYQIRLTSRAQRQLGKLDMAARRRVQVAIDLLASTPRPPSAHRLVGGQGEWRVRTGDYRVIYQIEDNRLLVLVITVGHRKDVYARPR